MSNKNDGVAMTHTQAVNRLKDITDELERLNDPDRTTPVDDDEWRELTEEFATVDEYRRRLERQADLDRVAAVSRSQRTPSHLRVERGSDGGELDRDIIGDPDSIEGARYKDPWNLSEMRTFNRSREEIGSELRARAISAIEQMPGMSQKRREGATSILENFDNERGNLSEMALLTSDPNYLRAFNKAARGRPVASFTQEESAAVERAMSLTDSAGGYLVPFQLDPTVIITSDGSFNQIRQAARQVIATGDVWNGVSAGETSWSWDAEAAEVSDDASTFAQPTVPIYKGAGFVPISLEAAMDEQNVASEVGRLLVAGKETQEAVAFAVGTGSGQPTGIVTALAGGASEVASATTDTFAIADVYAVHDALPARYRFNASWLANNSIYSLVRQFDTAGGAGMWERIGADRPPQLLGRNAYEAEGMDGTINATADNYAMVFGDFTDYVIADRIGLQVEFIPHLFATGNNRPSGQRGWYAYFRVGADSVNDGAFSMLNVT